MKVGKKLLSSLLAIMMIISSVSVCFGVLGATSTIDNLMSRIELHHSTLADYILAAESDEATAEDLKKVPQQNGNTWTVEQDSATSSWHWVAAAYSEAAKVVASSEHTYYGIYEKILEQVEATMSGRATALVSIDQYDEVLKYFAFGETEDIEFYDSTGKTVTLYIGEGFDILQWAPDYTQIPETESDLQLYTATPVSYTHLTLPTMAVV